MIILLLFSFLAGIVTVLSPCVLPVLPILLGAGFESGRERAWGIIIGFIGCFTLAILTFNQAVHVVGLPMEWTRMLAAAILIFFGLSLLIPRLEDWLSRIMAPLVRLGGELSSRSSQGFLGGIILGVSLGFLWTPCAGPILATIIVLSTLNAVSVTSALMTTAYAAGAVIPMLFIMHGSSSINKNISQLPWFSTAIRSLFGLLTLGAAAAIAGGWTDSFQKTALDYLPVIQVENNRFVRTRLAKLVNESAGKNFTLHIEESPPFQGGELPSIAPAPDFPVDLPWLNSKLLTLSTLKGNIVLIDFWTYSCINCLRTLPHLERLYSHYKDKGLVIIGVHTPEFSFERDSENVKAAIKRQGITYPVVQDNDYAIWRSYGNLYWPAHYLIDQNGIIRYTHFGEGKYMETENAIRSLLGLSPVTGLEERDRRRTITPEIYLGYSRSHAYPYGFEIIKDKPSSYLFTTPLEADQTALEGEWIIHPESVESKSGASYIHLNFLATRVYLVLEGKSHEPIQVMLDGKPLPSQYYTSDMNARGEIFMTDARKYDMINLRNKYGRNKLRIRIPEGVSAFAFTFGDE